jgi:WD40 repeat protein
MLPIQIKSTSTIFTLVRIVTFLILGMFICIAPVKAEMTEQEKGDIANQFNALVNHDIDSFKVSLHFDFDESVIKSEDLAVLDELGHFFEKSSLIHNLSIKGHTDQSGTDAYNQNLSQQRVNSVQSYLEKHFNLAGLNIKLAALGERFPLTKQPPRELKNAIDRRAVITLTISSQEYANQVDFASDAKLALTTTEENTAVLWNTQQECPAQQLSGHKQLISASRFSKNARLALTGSYDASMILWDTATGEKLHTLTGHTGAVTDIDFAGVDGSHAISASADTFLKLWDLETGLVVKTFAGHPVAVTSVAVSADNRAILSGDKEGTAIIWNPHSAQMLFALNAHQGRILDVDISPNAKTGLTVGSDALIHLWDIVSGKKLRTLASTQSQPTRALFSANGQVVISADSTGQLHLWSAETGLLTKTIKASETAIQSLAIEPTGSFILTGDTTRTAKLWDANNLTVYKTMTPANKAKIPFKGEKAGQLWTHPESGISFSWIPEGCFFVGCDKNDSQCAYDRNNGKQVCVDGFWLANQELNQKQWQQLMGSNPSYFSEAELLPVEQISWEDASQFICKLNGLGKNQFRFPTEIEWEYACRGDNFQADNLTAQKEADAQLFKAVDKTIPVNETAVNHFGLYGMNDNVWEWVADIYQDKGYAPLQFKNPLYTGDSAYRYGTSITQRGERGGNWSKSAARTSCGARGFDNPSFKSFFVGLRPVMVPFVKE